MTFDKDWNDFLGYMVYHTPGTGLGPDSRKSYNDYTDYEDYDEDEEEEQSNLPFWSR